MSLIKSLPLKKGLLLSLLCFGFSLFQGCTSPPQEQEQAGQRASFTNPVFPGFYPDPAICGVGDDFYVIFSSFSYFPGVPIFHSKDLVHWQQLGHILDRPEQLDLDGLRVTRGIFAPTISYHKGTFYMVTTLIDNGGNFVVTAKDPAGPWSDPSWLPQVNGIDPSLFFDDDGKAYIIYNSEAPENKPLYEGHRSVRMYEFDAENLKVVGEEYLLVDGGVDITQKPVWIEGPHIYKKDGYYYLMAAEGGTSVDHSEVIFRSEDVKGDYVPWEKNPILTQRHLDPARKNPVSATGHADLVQTPNGEWWAVFLGTRPYDEEDHYNTGRDTFLAPVSWEDGWPVINPDHEEVQYSYQRPDLPEVKMGDFPINGNFSFRDEFEADSLAPYWMFLRTPRSKWYNLQKPSGSLSLQLRPETLTEKVTPSFITRRQQHLHGSASTNMFFTPMAATEFAGLAAFQNEEHYYAIGKSLDAKNQPVVQLLKADADSDRGSVVLVEKKLNKAAARQALRLKIEFDGGNYAFYYASGNEQWKLLQDGVDGRFLSTRVAGGFVGATLGMYATSQGRGADTHAEFDWFEYEGNDPVFDEQELTRQ
jgi:xylan 1,4-beta-xylosidase